MINTRRFNKVFNNLHETERKTTIVIIDDKKISWKNAKKEIDKKTNVGKKIYQKLIDIGAI